MLRTERHAKILDLLQRTGVVRTIELSEEFDISRQTIHNDINYLDNVGKLVKVHGGAIPASDTFEFDARKRQEQNVKEKQQIGRVAASFVKDGDTIYIDTGTTMPEMLPHLKNIEGLTVITNSLVAAYQLADFPNINITLLGGEVNLKERSTAGHDAFNASLQYFVDKSFISLGGFDIEVGYTDYFHNESAIRKNMIKQCSTSFALFDHSKVGLVATSKFAEVGDIDVVITDSATPKMVEDHIRSLNKKYIVADQ